ncbi:MAG: hypothetical protein IH591_18470 [Bacteroidales bacterium]|nr:hypothetical protein [Bacteroidales bacterium]
MKNRFLHFLGVETGEESVVSLLLTQSVFIGLFYGAFDISAHSLFLAVFDETIMARAYVISGLAGIILTSIYSFVQTRLQFKNFAVVNLLFVTVLTMALWLLLVTNPSRTIIFTVFVLMGPLNILAMLGFWGTTGRLFTLRQGKRLFGLVDAGLIVGIIISSYAIPVLLTFGFNTHNIILLGAIAIFIASVVQLSLAKNQGLSDTSSVRKGSVKMAMSLFRKDSYVLNMGLFVSVSVMTAFFIQYSFMAVTREQYPLEADMAKFLGLFIGSMMIFTLFIKTFLFSYLIKNYGLKVILLLPPVLLMVFSAGAAILGSVLGFQPASAGFMIFFLILALSRLFSKAIKDAVETPSFKVIYQTLGEKVRYDVQSIVDGTVNEIAALTSGLFLSGLGLIVAGRLISFSWVLLAITILWAYFGYRLYSEYRKAIIRSLDDTAVKDIPGKSKDQLILGENRMEFRINIRASYPRLISEDFSLLKSENSSLVAREIIAVASEANDFNLVPALKWISGNELYDSELRSWAAATADNISTGKGEFCDPFFGTPVRREARELLKATRSPQPAMLLRILRDNSYASKRAALMSIARHNMTDMIPEVCELLSKKETAIDATAVLDWFGGKGYDDLARCFMRSSGNVVLMKNILAIVGRNCFAESSNLVYQMLRTNSRAVRGKAARILVEQQYRVPESEKDKIHQLITEIIGTLTWYMQASVALKNSDNGELAEAVNSEMDWWYKFLFSLLQITYDSQYIEKIKDNLETGTVESVNFALEMIDIVIDESIKTRVSYCVDISDNEEKLKSLNQFYPGFIPSYDDLLIEIINRDYNLTGLWTKAVAVSSLMNIADSERINLTLAALLFSPNRILVEEAVRIIVFRNPDMLKELKPRIPAENLEIVDLITGNKPENNHFIAEKVRALRKYLPGIPEDELIIIAEDVQYMKTPGSEADCKTGAFRLPAGATGDDNESYYLLCTESLMDFI